MNAPFFNDAERTLARRLNVAPEVLRPYCAAMSSLFQSLLNDAAKTAISTPRLRVVLMPEIRIEVTPEPGSRFWRRNAGSSDIVRLSSSEISSFLKTYLEDSHEIRADVIVWAWNAFAAALPVAPTALDGLVVEGVSVEGYAVRFRTGAARSIE
jgi:hypothetical protein